MKARFLMTLILPVVGSLTPPVALGADDQTGLRDIRGPVAYPLDPVLVALLLLIVLAGIAVLLRWWVRMYRRRRAYVPPVPPRPPWDIALELLEKLKAKKYLEYDKFDQYYSELSDILRRYMEDYFGIRAPEMTTEEFLVSIRHHDAVAEEHKALLARFMQQADVVKFAKAAPTAEEADQSWELARRFIMQSYEDEEDAK
ncbi:MAG: DUF4381 family protein [Candidatus Omnitrophica bacterium]|nr:DUF4381 family protein [Candidatus Omnitrophota bacterium]